MTARVELIPLKCVRCETPVLAQPDEIAWVCTQCGRGLLLDEDQGLVEQEVRYATGSVPGTEGRPFWVAEGRMTLQRDTYGLFCLPISPTASEYDYGPFDREAREARHFWSQPHDFFVPAFTCSLDTLISLGTNLLLYPPDLQPGSPVPFAPVTLVPRDVLALVEFIAMSVEAQRKDQVKEVDFSIQLGPLILWILPA